MGSPVIVLATEGLTPSSDGNAERRAGLPALGPFLDGGSQGILSAGLARNRTAAWATVHTGVEPFTHGLWGGRSVDGGPESAGPSVWRLAFPSLFAVAGEAGLRVAAVGVPLTWPPAAINGVVLTMPPDPWDSFPRGLWEAMSSSDRATLASVETTDGDRRAEGVFRVVRWMCDQQDSDLIAIGFRPLAGASRARGSRARTGATPGMPDGLGALLRLLVSEIPARALLLVSPTHAATVRSHLHLNAWLEQQGLLRLSPSGTARRALRRLSRRDSSACRFLIEQRALPGKLGQRRGVDWKRTSALADDAGIFLSCMGRSGAPEGSDASRALLADRADRARSIRDIIAGLPAVGDVWCRENLPAAPGLIPLPDLVVEPADEGIAACPSLHARSVMAPAPEGEFHMIGGGMLALTGDCARRNGDAVPMRLADVAPTILHILGVPVPDHMDGTVATELFDYFWLRDHPVRVVASPDGLHRPAADELSAVERHGVEAHLRALGYLG